MKKRFRLKLVERGREETGEREVEEKEEKEEEKERKISVNLSDSKQNCTKAISR